MELLFPGETSLADLKKSTALPKKSKHLIYPAATQRDDVPGGRPSCAAVG